MQAVLSFPVQCPLCWEQIDLLIDTSQGDHAVIEDCPVCCRPFSAEVRCEPGEVLAVEIEAA